MLLWLCWFFLFLFGFGFLWVAYYLFIYLKQLQILHDILLQAPMTSDDAMGSPLWIRAENILHIH